MEFPIQIELRRSRVLLILLLFFHGLALASVLVLPWPWITCCFLVFAIALSVWHSLRTGEILALRLDDVAKPECIVTVGADSRFPAKVMPDCTVFSSLVVLRLQLGEEKRIRNIPLLPDSMSDEQFRVLRLWLLWCVREQVGNDV